MRRQRPPHAAPAITARAEALPLDDDAVDAAMACVTIHHWESLEAGLAEMRRVARSRLVVLTFELDALARTGSLRHSGGAQRRYLTLTFALHSQCGRCLSREWSSESLPGSAPTSSLEPGMPTMAIFGPWRTLTAR